MLINENLDVCTFVINRTATQLDVSPDQITDETLVPDAFELFTVLAVKTGRIAILKDAQHCTVKDAIKAFSQGRC